ncbi:MAG: type secretion exporter [Ramlibacter sp.]|jgi:flagellar biosynthetic protein FlhB|uniref:EscU/YscU/HrcU family type III secretion system export apparatus switch protein n=1 Tax=Ramlibacter sp. TaxID=1917967 RepID=UPI00262F502B|nr:EscU/YscU/HrcU family type III secretion system export apparatus switch protein [Ramlibacter sp.]MDB5752113.1 type secretion exporter [Ramlibacter sp.]
MADQDVDRSEAATPFKLKQAQERGQTMRSADMVAAVVFAAGMVFLAWQGWEATVALLRLCRFALDHAGAATGETAALWPLIAIVVVQAGGVLLPLLLLLPLAAAIASLAQTGPVLALEPLKADFNRINPATGLKRVFSARTLFDGARACIKLLVLGLAAWLALRSLQPQFHAVASQSPLNFLQLLVGDTAELGLKMALALWLVACVDVLFTRHEFGSRMRMSRRELKDEFKNREGDPRIRARLRELRRAMLKRGLALRNTRTADVVLINPTHYAVALRYVHGEMNAPEVVAKGAGQLAGAMREIASRHRVAVVQNAPLARRLFREVDIDQAIPAALYPQVAKIIVWVFALREQRRAATSWAAA